ncbi:MAG: tRNA epoxyqueuosine(34) reductase QueG [Nevskia sp.]|nr:tRNA epoxyqueuosine(34) reductase QueG [Nevskia sp.]
MRDRDNPLPTDALAANIREQLQTWARALGFADAGVSAPAHRDDIAHLERWLSADRHGGMDWMTRNHALRINPAELHPGTLSVISVRLDYRPSAEDADAVLADSELGYVSRYALGRDYHKLMRRRLQQLAEKISAEIGPHGYRVFADSAPALEKALARNAGLGWIGKNTLLLTREAGSWFFLGEIYTDLPLTPTASAEPANLCGSCSACIDVCPTQAIVAPYQLDARRCISYLTIEHHGDIPEDLRPMIGNRIFGCDDCQLVCPWNRYARLDAEPDFAPRHGLDAAKLVELFAWSEDEWLRKTEGMALRRAGYWRWLRNLAVALGNAPTSDATISALLARAECPDPMARRHIQWALTRQQSATDRKSTSPTHA